MARCDSLDTIRSRQNSLLVETGKLNDRKHRLRSGCFRFDGVKLMAEALRSGVALRAALLRASDAEQTVERVERLSGCPFPFEVRTVLLPDPLFAAMSDEQAPEGVICVASFMTELHGRPSEEELLPMEGERVVLLESVRDPSNLGAIIRSAAAFDVDRLILSADCADIYNAKTVRASMGTLFTQRITRVGDLPRAITRLQQSGRRVFAAALDHTAHCLGTFAVRQSDCVVIGNEGHGLSEQTICACGQTVYIPMSERAESLNAAVAASVLMWHFTKDMSQGGVTNEL